MLWQSFDAVLNVKLAFCLHSLQMAESFLIFSHFGMRLKILGNAPLRKVPWSDEMMTTLPELAACSENSTMSSKNYPSSMPITSKGIHSSPRSLKRVIGLAGV